MGSIITNDSMLWDVFYSYKVTFKGIDSTERPVTLISPELKILTEQLEITPRELYSIVPVKILALTPFLETVFSSRGTGSIHRRKKWHSHHRYLPTERAGSRTNVENVYYQSPAAEF